VLHKAIGQTLDYALPAAGTALGTAAGVYMGNPALGAMIGKKAGTVGRKTLENKTGYGVSGVGEYNDKHNIDLAKTLHKYAPQYKDEFKRGIPGQVHNEKPVKRKRITSGRCDVVKQIMKEKGLSLPEASKFVKENKLW
jgi:hypothetical protein